MQYGNYVRIGNKENNLEAVALIAEDMAMTIREIEKDKPGSIVEKTEIIIKEDSIAWKVSMIESGGEGRKTHSALFLDGLPLSEEDKQEIMAMIRRRHANG